MKNTFFVAIAMVVLGAAVLGYEQYTYTRPSSARSGRSPRPRERMSGAARRSWAGY
jgi:hypothetical protein